MAPTSGVGRRCEAPDVQSAGDVVLYGGSVTPHHRADGPSQTAQVVKDLQGRADLSWILIHRRRWDDGGNEENKDTFHMGRINC